MTMFIGKSRNRSGSMSVQIIQKINRRNKVIKTIYSATIQQEIEKLENLAKQDVERIDYHEPFTLLQRMRSGFFSRKNQSFCDKSCKAAYHNDRASDFRKELVDSKDMEHCYLLLKVFHTVYPEGEPFKIEDMEHVGFKKSAYKCLICKIII